MRKNTLAVAISLSTPAKRRKTQHSQRLYYRNKNAVQFLTILLEKLHAYKEVAMIQGE